MSTLSDSIRSSSLLPALIIPSKPHHAIYVTHQCLHAAALSFQKQISALGITSGNVVSIALPNSLEFIVAFLGISWQRAVTVPLNPAYKQDEFEFYIDDVDALLILMPQDSSQKYGAAAIAAQKRNTAIAECYWNGVEVILDLKHQGVLAKRHRSPVHIPEPHDVALILHTSGTTGKPKAVPLTHMNLVQTTKNIQMTYRLTAEDRTLLVMPLFHVHGLVAGFLAPIFSGGSVIVLSRFSASQFWENFIVHAANWYTAVPTIHQILLRNPIPDKVPNIRFIRSCSSPLSPSTFAHLERVLKAPVLEAYAMTEAAHQITSNPLPPGERIPGSVGISQGVDVAILNQDGSEVPLGSEAEICIRGVNITEGYLNNNEANELSFTKNGFFRTGDQGKKDANGYIVITGRIKELINKGGEKISPVELDNVVAQNGSVEEAVSFAMADELYGQNIGIAIVLKEGAELTEGELRNWIATKVAPFKVPQKYYFTDKMPKTATGKVQRRMVAAAMIEGRSPQAKL